MESACLHLLPYVYGTASIVNITSVHGHGTGGIPWRTHSYPTRTRLDIPFGSSAL